MWIILFCIPYKFVFRVSVLFRNCSFCFLGFHVYFFIVIKSIFEISLISILGLLEGAQGQGLIGCNVYTRINHKYNIYNKWFGEQAYNRPTPRRSSHRYQKSLASSPGLGLNPSRPWEMGTRKWMKMVERTWKPSTGACSTGFRKGMLGNRHYNPVFFRGVKSWSALLLPVVLHSFDIYLLWGLPIKDGSTMIRWLELVQGDRSTKCPTKWKELKHRWTQSDHRNVFESIWSPRNFHRNAFESIWSPRNYRLLTYWP